MAIVNIGEGLLSMLEKVSGGGQLWIWRQEVVTDGYVGVVFIYLFIYIIFSNCQRWCMAIDGIGDFFLVVLMRVYGSGLVGIFFLLIIYSKKLK